MKRVTHIHVHDYGVPGMKKGQHKQEPAHPSSGHAMSYAIMSGALSKQHELLKRHNERLAAASKAKAAGFKPDHPDGPYAPPAYHHKVAASPTSYTPEQRKHSHEYHTAQGARRKGEVGEAHRAAAAAIKPHLE